MKLLSKIGVLLFSLSLSTSVLAQYGKLTGEGLLDKADLHYRTANYEQAKEVYDGILKNNLYDIGSKEWVIAKIGLGSSLLDLGGRTKGANQIFEADSLKNDNLELELIAYLIRQRAWANGAVGFSDKRRQDYELALAVALESGDEFRIAQTKINNALLIRSQDLKQSLQLAKDAATYFYQQNDYFHLSLAYSALFFAYRDLGAYEYAEKVVSRAVDINIKLKNDDLLSSWYWRGGLFFSDIGKFDQALLYYNRNLDFVDGNTSISRISTLYNNIGLAYAYLNDANNSLHYFERSLEIRRNAGITPDPKNLSNIATVYRDLGEFNKAESLFNAALEGFKSQNDISWIASTLEFLALLKLDTNKIEEAESYAQKAFNYATKIEQVKDRNSAWRTLAKVYRQKEEYQKSLDFFKKAYQADSKEVNLRFIGTVIELSKAYRLAGSDSAFYYANQAIEHIENVRVSIYGDYLQTQLFQSYASFYSELALWNLLEGNKESAFDLIERGKSRALLDQISLDIPLSEVLEEEEAIKIFEKSKRIDYLYRQIELQNNAVDKKDIKDELRDVELEYRALLNEAKVKYPALNVVENPSIISLKEIQDKLDNKTAVFEYAAVNDKLITFRITNSSVETNIQTLPKKATRKLVVEVSAYRKAIQSKTEISSLYAQSRNLYNWLIDPLFNEKSKIEQLLIVPDVSLSYLPFESLIDENQRFLIERVNIKYLPSLSLLNYINEPNRIAKKEILAVAGSGFKAGSTGEMVRSEMGFTSLPATLVEVESIAQIFDDVTLLKNESVSESELKALPLSDYKYIHFATHGIVNHDNPNQSGLILSQTTKSENVFGEDGLLNSAEIGFLKLNANLVVLSACNSGFGNNIDGEGLMGLQRSFLKAGSSSVLVSLWSVFDRSTAHLMASFYKNMLKLEEQEMGLWNKTLQFFDKYEAPIFGYKEKALKDAKIEMIEHPYYNHPVYWAPFVLIGK